MPIKYKIDVLAALKAKGFSTYKLRKDQIFGEGTIQAFRSGSMVSTDIISKLCELLDCQPGEIIFYEPPTPGGYVQQISTGEGAPSTSVK